MKKEEKIRLYQNLRFSKKKRKKIIKDKNSMYLSPIELK